MVWSQYVYEATTGFDNYASDDDDFIDDTPLNIEDWEVEYSDELQYMWNTIRALMYDAHIQHTGDFNDFVEFCFREHDSDHDRVTWEYQEQTRWFEDRLGHIWRHVRRIVNDNGLHEVILRGATFHHFAHFAKNYMCIY
jgi:hypothetical protein